MGFDVPAEAYQRFMGRYSEPLAGRLVELLAPRAGQRAIDVGAGTGAVTAPLVAVLGRDAVAAVEPSPPFVTALRERLPGVDVRQGHAASIPFGDRTFDLAVAQLVVHFMPDPVAGLAEMARVTRPSGTVAASVWDFAGDRAPLSLFWSVARELDPGVVGESALAGAREGDLDDLFLRAGLVDVRTTELTIHVPVADADEWWQSYTLGVGPAGAYVAGLDPEHREALRRRATERLREGSGVVTATAWTTLGAAG